MHPRVWIVLFIFIIFALGFFTLFILSKKVQAPSSPKPSPIKQGSKVKYPQDYTIVLVGDSMTERLGNSDEIRTYLKKYYPQRSVEVLNYGFGSTNILSVPDRLTKTTSYGRDFRPILDIDFNLILIESFGHNPLSEFPQNEGLKKQNETLDKILGLIKKSNPKAKVVFVATISPNKKQYALNSVELSSEKRGEWVGERTAYMKNHIEYAKSHDIPYINVFEKSLNAEGDGDLKYIDPQDFIHPSPSGIYLISQEIADFIYNNRLF